MGAPQVNPELKKTIRDSFHGAYILSGGYDLARAEADLAEKKGDLVAFGRAFLANPRLVSKLKRGAALTPPDFATFYTPGEKGYTDYPTDGLSRRHRAQLVPRRSEGEGFRPPTSRPPPPGRPSSAFRVPSPP
jgi:hypothetical protein